MCEALIDLSKPVGSERKRAGRFPSYTVWVYFCPLCKTKKIVRGRSYMGAVHGRSVPGRGYVRCGYTPPEPA